MRYLGFLALFFTSAACSVLYNPDLDTHWKNFKRAFGKTYSKHEEGTRRLIWEKHVSAILNHNLQAEMGLKSYKRAINEYSDMGHKEFVKTLNGFKQDDNPQGNTTLWVPPPNVKLPDAVDWRREGLVTQVKNQGKCGSCWAFSSTGSLEGQHKKKYKNLISLSEQNLVDCSRPEGNSGCNGGQMNLAFQYVKNHKGIDTESSYPYIGRDDKCHFKKEHIGATCIGHSNIPSGDENALKAAVATIGPISVAIDASLESFQTYSSGIYDEPHCNQHKLDHAVLVVGYGEEGGRPYWLVKNSWGSSWGMHGYIMMSRNRNNQCGIATGASYPLM